MSVLKSRLSRPGNIFPVWSVFVHSWRNCVNYRFSLISCSFVLSSTILVRCQNLTWHRFFGFPSPNCPFLGSKHQLLAGPDLVLAKNRFLPCSHCDVPVMFHTYLSLQTYLPLSTVDGASRTLWTRLWKSRKVWMHKSSTFMRHELFCC